MSAFVVARTRCVSFLTSSPCPSLPLTFATMGTSRIVETHLLEA